MLTTLVPRDYQIAAVTSLYDYFTKKQEGNPVVALPTGTGKALVIALFLESAFRMYGNQKILCATHVKELVKQNYEELLEIWPTAPAGIYSAGLKRKDVDRAITFCGIASIKKKIADFGRVDLFIVDEAHLISPEEETNYMYVINALKAINPYMRVIGLTATPWRQGLGLLTNGGIFTDICFDMTDMASFNWFIAQGYLAPLVAKQTETILDTSGVHLLGGEFNLKELNIAVNKDEITYAALQEAIKLGRGREHWLVFASGVDHALKATEMLKHLGISARCVHSKMTEAERDTNIKDWKAGKFTAMVNNGILTTGVNFKGIDLIVMIRPTHSTVLWVQMLGRGTRPLYAPGYDITTQSGRLAAIEASEKHNCLVLDFAGNCRRLGPINDPVIPRKKGEKTGEVPIKLCECCNTFNHISARYCGGKPVDHPAYNREDGCGAEFSFKILIKNQASEEEIIKTDEPITAIFAVDRVTYQLHQKAGKPDSIKVNYYCGVRRFNEFVLPEHGGGAGRKAKAWWKERHMQEMPATTEGCLERMDGLIVPTHIRVWVNKLYPEILQVSFTGAFAQAIIGDDCPF